MVKKSNSHLLCIDCYAGIVFLRLLRLSKENIGIYILLTGRILHWDHQNSASVLNNWRSKPGKERLHKEQGKYMLSYNLRMISMKNKWQSLNR